MDKEILFEVRNRVGFVTLNRPRAMNALTLAMILEMHAQLREWARSPHIYAVVVKGAGDKAFCAGGDLRALHASLAASGSLHRDFVAAEYRLDHFIYRFPKP